MQERKPKLNKRNVLRGAGSLGATSVLLITGCGSENDPASTEPRQKSCVAINVHGESVTPRSYELGQLSVVIRDGMGPDLISRSGIVEQDANKYRINVKDLPPLNQLGQLPLGQRSELTPNDGDTFDESAIQEHNLTAVIATPSLGAVGLSGACLSPAVDANNLPTTYIQLPSLSTQR